MSADSQITCLEAGNGNYEDLFEGQIGGKLKKLTKVYGTDKAKKFKSDFKREVTDVTVMQTKKFLKKY